MSSVLSGVKIAVLGGDDRELILISELVKMGATIAVAGFPREKVVQGAFAVNSVEKACKEAEVVILPLPGTDAEGRIRAVYAEESLFLTEKAIASMANNALVLIGSARQYLQDWAVLHSFALVETIELDEIAIPNSISTAEGAIQIAMENSRITLHDSRVCIIGFGRVGITLARTLKALGANVCVTARNRGQLARAAEMGCIKTGYDELPGILNEVDFVFNTVPAMILNRDLLKHANHELIIIDLASQPGGTDFEAASLYGIKAILAPGLPGKVAPDSAGRILAQVIPNLIIDELSKLDKNLLFGYNQRAGGE
ncbi:MAG: dipicolinate synthase subunit DpsA [Syntrophomonadaceae bacterium]|nr:dipicolinate synthase subunit DpsA [Syntrophomonadaceae bacterium]